MLIFALWIIGCVVIGAIGSDRTIGFWTSFFVSLILSPLIGLVIVLFSKSNDDLNKENQQKLDAEKKQQDLLNKIDSLTNTPNEVTNEAAKPISISDEIIKLKTLYDTDVITYDEYVKAKNNLLEK